MTADYKSTYQHPPGNWIITETKSGNIVGEYYSEKECVNRMVELLSGSPFDGWTPRYILIDPKSAIRNVSGVVYTDDIDAPD